MYGVERLAVVDEGLSHHEAGRRFGIDRRTVKKMLSYSAPPGYRRRKPVRRPKLDGFTGIVDADQAAALRGWKLDPAFDTLRLLLEARFGPRGKREYIQVLRLREDFPERQVTAAVRDAVKRRLIGFDAVKHLLLARIEKRPARLDLTHYPHLPQPFVAATRSADYATLLAGGAGHG